MIPLKPEMEIVLIAAMAKNRIIGKEGRLPWHLPEDLRRFKRLTLGKAVIMGRKTYDSIGKPLPGRCNIVLTRNRKWTHQGIIPVCTLKQAFQEAEKYCASKETKNEVIVIGGADIYRQTLDYAHRLEITEVHETTKGDVYFPEINHRQWQETNRTQGTKTTNDTPTYSFVTLLRV